MSEAEATKPVEEEDTDEEVIDERVRKEALENYRISVEGESTVDKDLSNYKVDDGPPILEEGERMPAKVMEEVKMAEAPSQVSAADAAKKEKELKKKLEKEAKMKKFLEKKESKKQATAEKPADKAKAKPEKMKTKEKGPTAEELLKTLENVTPGTKKPVDGPFPDSYNPHYVEAVWYPWWVKEGFFKPEYGLGDDTLESAITKRGKFVMVIPPPNVTGTLHLGHAIMASLEDTLTRWNRMCGKVTLWIPGCDHAGIATQMVVEKSLARTQGITRHDLGREEFTKRVWEWKEQKGDRIYNQLKRMGISADWDRASFTMDPKLSKAVVRAFISLFEWGFIYRSDRLVNWSCTLKSCISDIEVDKIELTGRTFLAVPGYKDKVEFGVLTSFAYKIDENTEIVVATTRPETMLGDVAIAVHPKDERYTHLIGKEANHPFVNRKLIIVADEMVEKDFGTGAVKITPAHDQNDYDVGKRHDLSFITIIDEDGNMLDNCGQFSGMKRFEARKAVVAELKKLGLFRECVDNPMVVPVCSRSKDIVEPLLKLQWYVNCTEMASQALKLVEGEAIRIIPDLHKKTWNHWMSGIRDWCISRQLWWGHQIPAYKVIQESDNLDEEVWVAAENDQEAMKKAQEKFPAAKHIKLERDQDVLDTWFSSGLFPFSVFGWPDKTEELDVFYPTDLLETGHDILFFWVARMVFMGSTLTKTAPFKDVFLHSLVRDAHGRKMSKSLGNVIDPLDVISGVTLEDLHKSLEEGNLDPKEIEKAKQGQRLDFPNGIPECGTDALRFALCAFMTTGRDINLDVSRVQGYRFFCNKIWNAVKFAMQYLSMGDYSPSNNSPINAGINASSFERMDRWILSRLSKAAQACNDSLQQYNFQEATTAIYNFWLYDLCDVYLESLKPKFVDITPQSKLTGDQRMHLDVLLLCVEMGLRLLSPFMPFLTEELWQRLPVFESEKSSRPVSLCVAPYPVNELLKSFESAENEAEVSFMNELIHTIRSTRATYDLPNKTKTEAFVLNSDESVGNVLADEQTTMCGLSFSKSIDVIDSREAAPAGCAAAVVTDKCTVYILLKGLIDLSKEEERIKKQIGAKEQQLSKLKETIRKSDYKDKVPQAVQELNTGKVNSLEGEIEQLTQALQSVKLILTEQ